MLLTLEDSKFSNLNLLPKDPKKQMFAQISIRILNKEKLGEVSNFYMYIVAVASFLFFFVFAGVIIYNGYYNKKPEELI